MNFHGKFRLGIPNRNCSGSKFPEIPSSFDMCLGIPRNSTLVNTNTLNFLEFLGITGNF